MRLTWFAPPLPAGLVQHLTVNATHPTLPLPPHHAFAPVRALSLRALRWRSHGHNLPPAGGGTGPCVVVETGTVCVSVACVWDCETLVPQLNRRRSLGPRRFSVLAGGLWNRNDGARAGHTGERLRDTHRTLRSGDPPAPGTGRRSCHCHSLFLLRLCGDGSFFLSSRRGGPRRRLRGCWLTRTTAHGAPSAAQVAPTDEGAQGRGPLVEPCADVPRDVARPAPPDLDLN